jgi:hypothetical protein
VLLEGIALRIAGSPWRPSFSEPAILASISQLTFAHNAFERLIGFFTRYSYSPSLIGNFLVTIYAPLGTFWSREEFRKTVWLTRNLWSGMVRPVPSKQNSPGATELESCPTDATPEVAPGEPSVCLPLCCDPNLFRNNYRGQLTRWNHRNLRVRILPLNS